MVIYAYISYSVYIVQYIWWCSAEDEIYPEYVSCMLPIADYILRTNTGMCRGQIISRIH